MSFGGIMIVVKGSSVLDAVVGAVNAVFAIWQWIAVVVIFAMFCVDNTTSKSVGAYGFGFCS